MKNRIDILNDGLELRFLQQLQHDSGKSESYVIFLNSVILSLTGTIRLGIKQLCTLISAVIYAVEHSKNYCNEMAAITDGLLQQGSSEADIVYEKLWTVLNCGVFHSSDKHIETGEINILSFAGMDSTTKSVLVEIILTYLWRASQFHGQTSQNEIMVVMDEFQNFPLKRGNSLQDMLCEGRKFNLSFLIATQSLDFLGKDVNAILNQSAVRLFFKPTQKDMRKAASVIENGNNECWMKCLQSLEIGESVAVGNFKIGQNTLNYPIILR